MDKFIVKLINLRRSNDAVLKKAYKNSFKTASKFLVYEKEFIPFDLFKILSNGEANLQKMVDESGEPVVATKYDKSLSKFYKKNSLKRDINYIADSISYLVLKKQKTFTLKEKSDSDLYAFDEINELSNYQNQPYSADDDQLRKIGQDISDHILQPTNDWLDLLDLNQFEKIPERYWQVAGVFKKRIWGKLQHIKHLDKKIFFCLGIDLENRELFYGLECLRTGTSKLSTEQIFKFDHFTKGKKIVKTFSFEEAQSFSQDDLVKKAQDFFTDQTSLYHDLINYIWFDQVDVKKVNDKIIPLSSKATTKESEEIDSNKKTSKLGVELTLAYEQAYLKYKGKNKLAKKIDKISDECFDVKSFELDGSEKLIKVVTSKSSSIRGAIITQSSIEASILEPEKSYIYSITDISSKKKSGILHIKKGSFDKIFEIKPERYTVIF